MFEAEACVVCAVEIPKMEPAWPCVCMQCQIQIKRKLVLDKVAASQSDFPLGAQRILPLVVRERIAFFLVHDERRRARKWYLRCSLVCKREEFSDFNQFLWSHGECIANISEAEGILDRILAFV